MIKVCKISTYGRDYPISKHFKLSEMACKDGSNTVKYSTELIDMLEALRAYVGGSISITSGYRTVSHNRRVGGARYSQHLQGTAADIKVKKNGEYVSAKLICCLCQSLGFKGIGYINYTSIHVDMRPSGIYRGDERSGYGGNVNGDFYRYFNVSQKDIENIKAKEEDDMTKAEVEAIVRNVLAEEERKRDSENGSDWSKKDREWSIKNNIIKGDGKNYKWKEHTTKEQVIAIIHRTFELLK